MLMNQISEAKATATEEQPRRAANGPNRRLLPHTDPLRQQRSPLLSVVTLDCRLIIWEHVLRHSQTRIERWRPTAGGIVVPGVEMDGDCFPYRLTTAGVDKIEAPLNLLLCCRQLYLECLPILYSTTFVFEMPRDLHVFQLCASPEGLSRVKHLVIALGQIDWPGSGPFFSSAAMAHPNGSLDEWGDAIHGLKNMTCLQELHVWLGHRHAQSPELERRPWKEEEEEEMVEQRHNRLFELFGMVRVPTFTLHLTWMPEDLLARRQWPFGVELHRKDEMMHVLDHELPEKSEPDLYDW